MTAAAAQPTKIPRQQFAAARIRARETGRDLAVVDTTGPTALVRTDGAIATQASPDWPQIAPASSDVREARTLCAYTGDVPWMMVAASHYSFVSK